MHLAAFPTKVSVLRDDVSPELDACIAKMMSKEPNSRYQTAEQVIEALKPFYESVDSGSQTPKKKKKKRSAVDRRKIVAGSLLFIVALFFIGWIADLLNPQPDAVDSERPMKPSTTAEMLVQLKKRSWRLLVVSPPEPYMTNYHLLHSAIDDLGIECKLSTTSSTLDIDYVGKVLPLREVNAWQFDGLIFVGSEEHSRTALISEPACNDVNQLIYAFRKLNRPIASFGTGIWTINDLGLINGKRVANCQHTDPVLKQQGGATWVAGTTVVADGDLLTGTNMDDARPFLLELLRMVVAAKPSP